MWIGIVITYNLTIYNWFLFYQYSLDNTVSVPIQMVWSCETVTRVAI